MDILLRRSNSLLDKMLQSAVSSKDERPGGKKENIMGNNAVGSLVLSLFFGVAAGLALILANHFNWEGENYVIGIFVLSLLNIVYVLYTGRKKRN